MLELHKALSNFWGQLELHGESVMIYDKDKVPINPVMPCLTYDATQGSYFSTTVLTAFVWFRKETNWLQDRDELMDAVARMIPEEGVCLRCDNGYARLQRNPADFLSPYEDPSDLNIASGRISYIVTNYIP